MYKENDNLNKEEIDKFRSMSQAERDKLLAEKESFKRKEELESALHYGAFYITKK